MLMSLSLSQKLRTDTGLPQRLVFGYAITDEIYAVAIHQKGSLQTAYCLGLMTLPVIGWSGGTLLGALAGFFLPEAVRSALGISLYAMFVAILMPPIRQSRPILLVVLLAAGLSLVVALTPILTALRGGWQIILCTVIAALAGAILAPIQDAGATPSGETKDGDGHD
jgi:predicted branched-subunit amino acid permease